MNARTQEIQAGVGVVGTIAGLFWIGWYLEILPFVTLTLALQWIGATHAIWFKTEKYYDLMGAGNYLLISSLSLMKLESWKIRNLSCTSCIIIWCSRLGSFLFARIQKQGHDPRFNDAKQMPMVFFLYWTLQACWVCLMELPVLILNHPFYQPQLPSEMTLWEAAGLVLWLLGFCLEVVADEQKAAFRAKREKGETRYPFITTGVWKYSQHPNYFGEIVLWWGLFFACCRNMWMEIWLLSMLSPVFITVLLIFAAIPMLDAPAAKKWQSNPAYQEYRERTSVLCLWWNQPKTKTT